MGLLSVNAVVVGASWGAPDPDVFAGVVEPDEVDEVGRFGPLTAVFGALGESGPGIALRFEVDAAPGQQLELRLRHDGRYVPAGHRRWADRHRDLTLTEPLPGFRARKFVFLPYAALPERCPRRLVVEVWLVEDGEPVAEALWPLQIPGPSSRMLDHALAAVVFAAVSAAFGGGPRPEGEGVATSRVEPIVAALSQRFGLDEIGRAWLRVLVDRAEPAELADVVLSVRRFVDPEAWSGILGLLRRLAPPRSPDDPEHRWLDRLEAKLGAAAPTVVSDSLSVHYRTLGLEPGVAWTAVREAYRRLAHELHPDRSGGGPEPMVKLNAAYAALRAGLSGG